MSWNPHKLLVAALALCLLPKAARTQLGAVSNMAGPATKLSSVTYNDPPHEHQIKLRLTGAQMLPLPRGLFDVKQLMVEQFDPNGKLQAQVEAPECIYAPMDGVANSSGHLQLNLMDGRVRVEGDGFLWRQSDNSLAISNNVSTFIKTGTWSLTVP